MFSYLKDQLTGSEEEEQEDQGGADLSDEQSSSEEKDKEDEGGFLSKARDAILKTTIDDDTFDDIFWELETILLRNNVAKSVVDRIRDDLHDDLVDAEVSRGGQEDRVKQALRTSINDVLQAPPRSLIEETADHKPLKIVIIGVNGSGKTTTAAKLVKYFQSHDKTCVLGAADTYRAAAIQQLEEHADALGTKLIKHDYGADPAAVAYDTVQHATSSGHDACVIDTAGRLHNDDNLMQQLEKIIRVAEPHKTLYVAESVTGNDAVNQVEAFQDHVGIDGVIMSKADADDKGGAVLSVSHVTGAPVYFLGTGQGYDDLEPFDTATVLDRIGL